MGLEFHFDPMIHKYTNKQFKNYMLQVQTVLSSVVVVHSCDTSVTFYQ